MRGTILIHAAVGATYLLLAAALFVLGLHMPIAVAALCAYGVVLAIAPTRLLLVLLAPLLAFDCLANLIVAGGSWRNTLSGEAWQQREQPYFFWTHQYIDTLFWWQPNHCRNAAEAEAAFDGIWTWWAARWAAAKHQGA